jgi:DNA-binding SARP family transcriptional activator
VLAAQQVGEDEPGGGGPAADRAVGDDLAGAGQVERREQLAVRASRQLVGLAPLRESGYQVLMRALASQGNVAEALGVHARLRDILRDELGISPCAATQDVYDHLLRA